MSKRPTVPPLPRALNIICLILLAVEIGGLVLFWGNIPDSIPTHFNFLGEPDAWGAKGTLSVPLFMSVMLYALLTVTARFPALWNVPQKQSEEGKAKVQRLVLTMIAWHKLILLLMFGYILLNSARCMPLGPWLVPAMVVGITLPLVWFLVQSRRLK